MKIAIVPGSFDPMTLGHKSLIERAGRLFDEVVVAIMVNPDKKGMFDFEERKAIAELTLAGVENVRVITSDGYLADLAAGIGAVAIVKGVRNTTDFEYEQEMAAFNHARCPSCETVYLPAYGLADISSTAARKALADGADTGRLLSADAAEYIKMIMNNRGE